MPYTTLSVEEKESTAIITILNPPVNAITPALIDDLDEAFSSLEQMPGLRAVVVASGIKKIFVAGADINQFVSWKRADGMKVTRRGHDVFSKIAGFKHPVICAISGIAYGGGLELALACDIRVISRKAKVGLPEVGLGIIPGYGGTQRLPRLVGAGMAKKMIFTAEAISGEEAYRIGLAEVLTEPDQCVSEAENLARMIAQRAPLAVTEAKKSIERSTTLPKEDGICCEIESVGLLADTADKTEGALAFLEKRTPSFSGM